MILTSLALVALTAGCNESQTGSEGNIAFTPDHCDIVGSGCTFDDSMAAGGTMLVNIRGLGGASTVGVDLVSDDAQVLAVVPIADVNAQPTWQLTALAAGVATLEAIDRDGARIDFIQVSVQELDAVTMKNFLGDAVGGDPEGELDQVFQINANQDVSFYAVPMAGPAELTGRLQYTVTVDAALAEALNEASDVPGGYYAFSVPAGDYAVSLTSDNGTALEVLFRAQ
jgi:hypothetical protein